MPPISTPAPGVPQVSAPFLWKADDLPFFCRIEYHLGKRAQVPFKFRLGSVEYVDWLEGKPGNAGYLPN